jgi:hypothetical protein
MIANSHGGSDQMRIVAEKINCATQTVKQQHAWVEIGQFCVFDVGSTIIYNRNL